MENIWIPITIITAFIQTGRNGLMKNLKSTMHDETIMLSRFVFSVPIAFAWLSILYVLDYQFPGMNSKFFIYASAAAICQIIAGMLFLKLFGRRNFVIGVTYNQTQVIMNVIFSAIIFMQFVSLGALAAIILSFVGVVMITVAEKHIEPKNLWQRLFTPSAMIGLGCGAFFGITGVFLREAILVLDKGEFFVKSSYTLLYVLTLQAIIMSLITLVKQAGQFKVMIKHAPKASMVGLTNAVTTFGWFLAFSLTHSAHVYMVGQIEVIFSILLSRKIFKENISKLELFGMFIVVGSIILLVLYK